jgi:hypothetical protein
LTGGAGASKVRAMALTSYNEIASRSLERIVLVQLNFAVAPRIPWLSRI